MLAAMPTAPTRPPIRDEAPAPGRDAPARDRDDSCPGALRLHAADDGALARVRVPGGVLGCAGADALAEAARRFGDGDLHLTSRGNVQLRALDAGCGGALSQLLGAAGLLPSPDHERVRNVVASPLAGLDGSGAPGVLGGPDGSGRLGGPDGSTGRGRAEEQEVTRSWLAALDEALCASEAARRLSGRFLFALDDGRGDVAALGADVTLISAAGGAAWLRLGPHAADSLRLPAADGPRAAMLAAEAFVAAAEETAAGESGADGSGGSRPWRVAELPGGAGPLLRRLARRLAAAGVPADHRAPAPEAAGHRPRPGLVGAAVGVAGGAEDAGAEEGTVALSVLAPLGRLTPAQWRLLTGTAREHGRGELRLTPWRGVVVPGLPRRRAGARLRALGAAGLVTDPGSPWARVSACTGRPGCAKSLADVRTDAADALPPGGPTAGAAPPVHWSGCERRCGRPAGDRVDVVAGPDGYRVTAQRGGRPGPTTTTTSPSQLAAAVAAAAVNG